MTFGFFMGYLLENIWFWGNIHQWQIRFICSVVEIPSQNSRFLMEIVSENFSERASVVLFRWTYVQFCLAGVENIPWIMDVLSKRTPGKKLFHADWCQRKIYLFSHVHFFIQIFIDAFIIHIKSRCKTEILNTPIFLAFHLKHLNRYNKRNKFLEMLDIILPKFIRQEKVAWSYFNESCLV